MNKLKRISAFVLLFSVVFFSCTTEPYGGVIPAPVDPNAVNPSSTNTPVVTAANVVGNYILTAHNTSIPTDLNTNGTASTNQMLEVACFNGSTLKVNANGSFDVVDNYADIENIGGVDLVRCGTGTDNGTWTYSGNILTLTTTTGTITVVQTGTFANNNLTINVPNTEFLNYVNGNLDFVQGTVQLVFTKQ